MQTLDVWPETIRAKQESQALIENSGQEGSSQRIETSDNQKTFSWLDSLHNICFSGSHYRHTMYFTFVLFQNGNL